MLRTLAINSNQIVLSFGVLIAFWSPKQSEIEKSSLESMAKDVRTGRPDTPSEGGGTQAVAGCWNDVARLVHFSQWSRQHIRIGYAIVRVCDDRECRVLLPKGVRIGERATCSLGEFGWSCSADIPPGCLTSEILLRRNSTRMGEEGVSTSPVRRIRILW